MDAQSKRFELAPYLGVIARQKHLILTFCLSAALTSLALTYIFSEKYLASTTILYRPKEAVRFQPKQQEALGFPTPFVSYDSIGNTLEELAKSDAITTRVVQELNLDKPAKAPGGFRGLVRSVKEGVKDVLGKGWQILKYGRIIHEDPFIAAVHKLQANIGIKPTKKAYTFQLQALDSDPQRAAVVVDTEARVLAQFLSNENVRSAQHETQQLQERLQQNQREVAEARSTLEKFKRSTRVASLSEQISLQLKAVSNLDEELAKTEVELHSLQQKHNELRASLAEQQQFVKYLSTTTDNPVVQDLRLELSKIEVQRAGLLERLTPENPEVKTLDARGAEIRQRLKSEVEKIVSSESTRLNDIYQKILADALTTEADLQAAAAKRQSLQEAMGRAHAQVAALSGSEARLAELTLTLDTAERSYKLLNQAYEEARIGETMGASEVGILHPALRPSSPVRPIKIIHVAVSALMSLVLAVGFVFFLNYFDSSIRNVEDASRLLNLPVLSTVPGFGPAEMPWDCCLEREHAPPAA